MLTPQKALMKFKFFILLIFIFSEVTAQDTVVNLKELKQRYVLEKSDSLKASIGFELGNYYMDEQSDSATYYFYKSYKLIENTSNDLLKGSILHNLGFKFELNHNYKKALEYYKEAAHFYEKSKDTLSLAKINNNIGYGYTHLFNEDKSIGYYLISLALYKKIGDKNGVAINLTDIASLYYDYENYEKLINF